MSLTRFGVTKLRAAVEAMLKEYDGAGAQMATQCRITSLASRSPTKTAISPRYLARMSLYMLEKSPPAPGYLSVTETLRSRLNPAGGRMSEIP